MKPFGIILEELEEKTDELNRQFRELGAAMAALNLGMPDTFSEEEVESTVEKLKEIVVFLETLTPSELQ